MRDDLLRAVISFRATTDGRCRATASIRKASSESDSGGPITELSRPSTFAFTFTRYGVYALGSVRSGQVQVTSFGLVAPSKVVLMPGTCRHDSSGGASVIGRAGLGVRCRFSTSAVVGSISAIDGAVTTATAVPDGWGGAFGPFSTTEVLSERPSGSARRCKIFCTTRPAAAMLSSASKVLARPAVSYA